jgi:signal recognition particle subunit SRP54
MGSMKDLLDKMPLGSLFGGQIPDEVLAQAGDDKELVKIESMIQSMTKQERRDPELFLQESARSSTPALAKLTRRKVRPRKGKSPESLTPEDFVLPRIVRVARGSGRAAEEVVALVSRFMVMRQTFGMLGDLMGGGLGGGGGGLFGKAKQAMALRRMARDPEAMQQLQSMMGGGGIPGMPGMPGGAGGLGALGAGGGMPDIASLLGDMSAPTAKSGKAKKKDKDKRKHDRKARRKNRGK